MMEGRVQNWGRDPDFSGAQKTDLQGKYSDNIRKNPYLDLCTCRHEGLQFSYIEISRC